MPTTANAMTPPPGWRLVPEEPTAEMVAEAIRQCGGIGAGSCGEHAGVDGDDMRSVWDAMLTAAPPAPVAAGWMDIASAPKDGTYVLVFPATWKSKTCSVAKYNDDHYAKKPRPYWERDDDLGRVSISRSRPPSHWMPLPPSPEAEVRHE